MVNKKSIREMLQFQDLSEEEKQRRGILGRLYGPCASITDATRNGRRYDDELWQNVFSKNEIVREMFENGGIPMELDHPVDREETDSQRIAAMLPEPPKKDKDGHLICYVDIIDTPCGRIAYQLAKYGFKLGISSRGSGDVLPDDTVDPDTYDFTTFDLVLLPAVKDARLSMVESLDAKSQAFKKAMTESYNNSSNRDKEIMKETLEDLNINIDLDKDEDKLYEEEAEEDTLELDEVSDDEITFVDDEETKKGDEDIIPSDDVDEITFVDEEEDEESAEETKEEADDENTAETVKDFAKQIKNFDDDAVIEFKPIVIDDKEYEITDLAFDDSEDGKVVISINYNQEIGDNTSDEDDDIPTDEIDTEAEDEDSEEELELKVDDEEAIDDGEEEVEENSTEKLEEAIKTLAETVRAKDELNNKIKTLQSEKAVRDTEVEKLTEELNKYKSAFERTSVIAAGVKEAESKVKSLTEQLNAKDAEIENVKNSQKTALDESIKSSENRVKMLINEVKTLKEQLEQKDAESSKQINAYRQSLQEKVNVAKKYKAEAEAVKAEYINYRASMLGVRPSEITSKLDEKYTISDIEKVCDTILTEGAMRPTFGINTQQSVKITEPKKKYAPNTLESGYEIDDSLLELAGLKN